ncbi:conjugal transfer protein TraR [Pacificimonas flava]|uniref:Conjugal transfer protein TraR n=2 Tax=Pacificimonas TaxID=1960290 RepID=A0A219B830_9SPHN|nr:MULTISPECIES: TraR/DksA family transcriptional regulator [Pacificimonas]MBZ6378421.1 TraR/DksA C4-type zinc finger protein [Pacificimonas aurantium]OWV34276.1 conjugal transfer protein TraR [Pacificimonas flava]
MTDSAAAKIRLQAMQAELEQRLARVERDLGEPLNADSSEQAVELSDDEVLEGEGILVARELASVRRALGRIEQGSYGECVRCGADIAPGRLEARPEAALCIACASAETPRG